MTSIPWPSDFEALLRNYLLLLEEDTPITPDLVLADYGLDSLATVSLLLDLESHYSLTIPDELLTVSRFTTPSGVWTVLEQILTGGVAT